MGRMIFPLPYGRGSFVAPPMRDLTERKGRFLRAATVKERAEAFNSPRTPPIHTNLLIATPTPLRPACR